MGGKIIFVNSFKGGAGKTTLSLMHCITNLFQEKNKYENVIYIDLDLLGTATSYLFEEGKLPRELCFNDTGRTVEIELTLEGKTETLHVAYLDPGFKNRSFSGDEYYIHHKELDEELLKFRLSEFINGIFAKPYSCLLVIDCAPGFSQLEQELLMECYHNKIKWNVEVEEKYVTTLDAAHIQKSISCIRSSTEAFEVSPDVRTIHFVLNDIQNYSKWVKEEMKKDVMQIWKDIAARIKKELEQIDFTIYCWRYSQNIAVNNTYTSEEKVENQVDDYRMTEANYVKL